MKVPLQNTPHGGGRVRFNDVVVDGETAEAFGGGGMAVAADDDDGQRGTAGEGAGGGDQCEAVHAGQLEIGDEDAEGFTALGDGGEGFTAIGGGFQIDAGDAMERHFEHGPAGFRVVDDEDGAGHGGSQGTKR